MDQNKAILEALAEAECILYYATGENKEQADKIKEMQQTIYNMVRDWHDLTGVIL